MHDPNRRTGFFIALIAVGVFLIGAAAIPFLSQAQRDALESTGYRRLPAAADYPAPPLALTDLQGRTVSLEDYLGQVVLVNNWATWCPPCRAEMPELQAYYEDHLEQGFVVVAIESGGTAEQVGDFVRQYGLTFPVWLDPQGAALTAFRNFNLPSSYVIARDGTVRMSWTGAIDRATLEEYLTPLLEE